MKGLLAVRRFVLQVLVVCDRSSSLVISLARVPLPTTERSSSIQHAPQAREAPAAKLSSNSPRDAVSPCLALASQVWVKPPLTDQRAILGGELVLLPALRALLESLEES